MAPGPFSVLGCFHYFTAMYYCSRQLSPRAWSRPRIGESPCLGISVLGMGCRHGGRRPRPRFLSGPTSRSVRLAVERWRSRQSRQRLVLMRAGLGGTSDPRESVPSLHPASSGSSRRPRPHLDTVNMSIRSPSLTTPSLPFASAVSPADASSSDRPPTFDAVRQDELAPGHPSPSLRPRPLRRPDMAIRSPPGFPRRGAPS